MPRIHVMRHELANGDKAVTFSNLQNRASMTIVDYDHTNTNICNDTTVAKIYIPQSATIIADPKSAGLETTYDTMPLAVVELDSTQLLELGAFCNDAQDVGDRLRDIAANAKYIEVALEAWNERARIDEEHPPYAELVGRLREIQALVKKIES